MAKMYKLTIEADSIEELLAKLVDSQNILNGKVKTKPVDSKAKKLPSEDVEKKYPDDAQETEEEVEPKAEELEETEEEEITLEGHVIPAAKKYVDAHSREEVQKIFKKFGAKNSRELKEKDYPAVLKLLAK